jgi:transmembrane sensor
MNAQIQSEAADWLVEFQTGEPDALTRERFTGWLGSSPEHVRAYIELVAFWEDASLYDRGRAINVEALIAAARAEPNVVPLMEPGSTEPKTRPARAYRSWAGGLPMRVGIAACLALLAIAAFVISQPPIYSTGIGEQRTVRLADGSSVELDAVSRIQVHFSAHERRVDLLEGQALFRVAKNAQQPFVVVSGGTRVRDVGTQFDINRRPSGTVVTVLEGRVSVTRPDWSIPDRISALEPLRPIEVDAGEQVLVAPHMIPRLQPANLTTATAWTRNELIFDATPLPEAAAEFNRLNTRQLVIEGQQLQSFHISGVFPALDPASLPRFVHFLRAQPGIQVTETDNRIIVTKN